MGSRITSCMECPVGRASNVGAGGFCPFVDRRRLAGQLIYLEGDRADHVWFIKSGTVVLRRASDGAGEGSAHTVRFAGSFVGLEALVEPTYRDSARAASDVVLCGATREGMDAWLGPAGTPARTALELTLRAGASQRPRAAAPDGSAVARVARWLAEEGPRGAALILPRKIVAELLGMRAETLSRSLARLTEMGAIESRRTEIRILDQDALLAAAGH